MHVFAHGRDFTAFPVILPFPKHFTGVFNWTRLSRKFSSISMASSASSYSFTDDEVTQLARCTDQAEFLYLFKRILQSKSIDLSAVFDAQTTLGTSTDYGASVLTRFFEAQSPNKTPV